jgi:hypothetical protein
VNARTDLARLLGKHYGTSAGGDDYLWAMADIVLELLHPVITTAEDLDALPVGSVLLDAHGRAFSFVNGAWRSPILRNGGIVRAEAYAPSEVPLPATVLHVGGAE